MRPTDNPYSPGAGSPPPELAGRDELLNQASVAIQRIMKGRTARSLLMLGLRGVGKTVLLNRISQIAEDLDCHTVIFEADSRSTLPELLTEQLHRFLLKIDRRRRVSQEVRNAFSLLRGFAGAFSVRYSDIEIGLTESQTTGDLALDLTDLLTAIAEAADSRDTTAVILIDEVQFISQHDLSALVMALHRISQRQLPLLLMGAGLPQLAGLVGEAKSYAERLFEYPLIGRLSRGNATRALVLPAKEEGVTFEEDGIELILQETDGYPFFIQVWGFHAWDVASDSPITVADVKQASKNAIAALDAGFFRVRTDRLTKRQLDYVIALASLESIPATSTDVAKKMEETVTSVAPIRDTVIRKGVAFSPSRGMIEFTVPKFDEFVRRTFK
ncbi:MAG: ATP-binding protein [Rhodothermia bacterium]|nr:MAG: ATP-binding protein [Rhodothermia bacterium]